MKRKVIKQGHNTLTITLPAKWVERNSVKAGDEIDIEDRKNSLLMTKEGGVGQDSKIVFDFKDYGVFNKNYLSCLYAVGYDEIEFTYSSVDTFKGIQEQKYYCMGFEVISQRKNGCVIKSISNMDKEEFESILRRTFIMLLNLIDELYIALETNDKEAMKEIRALEHQNNRFTCVMRRMLYKYGYSRPERTHSMYALSIDLEKLADDFKRIIDTACDGGKLPDKKILDVYKKTADMVRAYYENFYKFDPKKAEIILKDSKKNLSEARELIKTTKGCNTLILHNLINAIIRTYEMYENYIEINF
jgi:phosphate uptake regulator